MFEKVTKTTRGPKAVSSVTHHTLSGVFRALGRNTGCLSELFMRINSTFSKDSSDCIATLSSVAEFIQHLVAPPETPPEATEDAFPVERTMVLSSEEVLRLVIKGLVAQRALQM